MKRVIAIVGLALINASFGLDEYLSIDAGKTEIDAGYTFTKPTGKYDSSGDKQKLPSGMSPIQHSIPLQVKYGILSGLDAELAIMGQKSNKDAGDMGGFGQPDLAVKYTLPQYGAGAFVDLTLPFVTGNLDFPFEPAMGLALGAVYQNRFGNFRITGMADYQINFENKDKIKLGNVFLLYAKPEAMWTEFIGTYLGIKYAMIGESAFDGRSNSGSDGYLLTLLPGINTQLTKSLAYEINVPFTLMGKNTNSSWGISANFYATLPLVN